MASGRISLEITTENHTKIMEAIRSIETLLPGLVGLTEEERSSLVRLGDKNLAHVQKALSYAEQNSQLIPSFVDVSEWKKDVHVVTQLTELLRPLYQLTQKMEDSARLAGDEAYTSARAFYQSVKVADQSCNLPKPITRPFPCENICDEARELRR